MRPRYRKLRNELDSMLSDLRRRWALGKSLPYTPAAGSAAELGLKLAVAEG